MPAEAHLERLEAAARVTTRSEVKAVPAKFKNIRLYGGDWIANEGRPWLLCGGWVSENQLGVERWLFTTDGKREGTLFRPQLVRHWAGSFPALNVTFDLDYLFETVRRLAEADLEVYLDEKYQGAVERANRRMVTLRPVDLVEIVRLGTVEESQRVLVTIAKQARGCRELRDLLYEFDGMNRVGREAITGT